MNPDLIPRQVVYSVLRANLPLFAVACIIMLGGVCVLVLARLRSRDRLLVWVGVLSLLYAARLFVENELVRDAFNAPGQGYIPWALSLTYIINIPFSLFALDLLGEGWIRSIALWSWLMVAFALLAIPIAFAAGDVPWVTRTNEVLVIGGTVLMLAHLAAERRTQNALAVSLLWPLAIFGAFIVLQNEGVRLGGKSIEPVGFLFLLAGFASIAVRRALATERALADVQQELSTARRIQSSIIPQSCPAVNGLRLATRYQPMTEVAGDFFDFLQTSDHFLTILVADVSGHGVPAALVACMLKVCFAAQKQNSADPAAILAGLSRMLRDSLGGQYLTAACAAINTESRTVTYAGAGHPPTLLARVETREIELLAENGLFIGPFPNASYANMSVSFRKGDRLLLYTDGITEANDRNGEEFGRENLEQFLLRAEPQEPSVALGRLFEQISTGTQQDDLTAVLVYLD